MAGDNTGDDEGLPAALLEECRIAAEEVPGVRLVADKSMAQSAIVAGGPKGTGIQCWLDGAPSQFSPLLLLLPEGYPEKPPTACFNGASSHNQPLLEVALNKFKVAIKNMSTPHGLAKVARAWKESVAGATQQAAAAVKQPHQQVSSVAATS
jgi:hypothetical protein